MKALIDKPFTHNIKNFDRMVTELSPYMTELEIDQCIEFMMKVEGSKWDINPSIEDCKTQLKLILTSERYEIVVDTWKQKNQKLLSAFGTRKYKSKLDPKDKTYYDGLSPEDRAEDWEIVYV